MRVRTIAAVAVLLLVAATVTVPTALAQEEEEDNQQVVGNPDLSFTTSAGAVDPGSAEDIELSVVNRGDVRQTGPAQHQQRVQTARGLVVRVDSGDSPIRVNTGELTAGDVGPGSATVGVVSLSVPADVDPGTYRLDVEYSYEYTRSVTYSSTNVQYNDLTRTRDTTLEITVDDQAQFEVEEVESSVLAGQSGEIEMDLRNTGNEPARDASVSVASLSQDLVFGSGSATGTAYVGEWPAGSTKTVTFEAGATPQANTGNYTVETSVTYTDTNGVDQAFGPISVGAPVGGKQNIVLNDVESTLQVGYEGTVSATLVNDGPEPMHNPVVVLNTTDPRLTVTSPDQALPNLAPGENAPIDFTVDVSSEMRPTQKQLDVLVNWEPPSGSRLTAQPLRPSVEIKPQQDRFAVEASNGTIPAGESKTVEVWVTNQGTEPLTNVEAQAYFSGPLSSEDNTGFIPELAPDETKSVLIDVSVAPDANREHRPMELDFQYELPNGGSELSDKHYVPIEVIDPQGGGGWLPMAGGAVIAALIAGGLVYRRRSGGRDPAATPG